MASGTAARRQQTLALVVGFGLFLAYVFVSELTSLLFEDFAAARALTSVIPTMRDAGCLAACAVLFGLWRGKRRDALREPDLPWSSTAVAVGAFALSLATLLKAGYLIGGGDGALLAGSFACGFLGLGAFALWAWALVSLSQSRRLAVIATSLVVAVGFSACVSVLPDASGKAIAAVVPPWACGSPSKRCERAHSIPKQPKISPPPPAPPLEYRCPRLDRTRRPQGQT